MEIGPLQKDSQNIAIAPVSATPETAARNRELIQAVKAVNAAQHFGMDNELTFVMDRHTQRPVIRVVNLRTKEVIQQIPPRYLLELAKRSGGSDPDGLVSSPEITMRAKPKPP
jgi:uncharacterized FlaG/YvyC family protein